MKEDDPKALFSQQIPKSFLDLQQDIRKLLVDNSERQLPPIMEEEAFREAFRKNFEDDEEMTEAVYCLNLQGTYMCTCMPPVRCHECAMSSEEISQLMGIIISM